MRSKVVETAAGQDGDLRGEIRVCGYVGVYIMGWGQKEKTRVSITCHRGTDVDPTQEARKIIPTDRGGGQNVPLRRLKYGPSSGCI